MRREQGPKQMKRSEKRDDRGFRVTLEALEAAVWMRTPLCGSGGQRWLGLMGRRCGGHSLAPCKTLS